MSKLSNQPLYPSAALSAPRQRARRLSRGGVFLALLALLAACGGEGAVSEFFPGNEIDLEYHGVQPARVLDTRSGRPNFGDFAPGAAPLAPGEEFALQIRGVGGIPAEGAGSVVLNVTATQATAPTFVTVWPSGTSRPNASTLNVVPNRDVANLTVMALPADGKVRFFNESGSVHVIVDVLGWFSTNTGFLGVNPARLADTRVGANTVDGLVQGVGKVGADSILTVPVLARGGVPQQGVAGVVVNVTATNSSAESFLTVWPSGTIRPNASNLNMGPGRTVPNLVLAQPGSNGAISIYNESGTTDVIVDVVGYVPSGSQLAPTSPARILDTRSNATPVLYTLRLAVAGHGGVPTTAGAVVLNVTAISTSRANGQYDALPAPAESAYVTVYPTDVNLPATSSVNVSAGATVANLVVTKLGADGAINFYASAKVELIVDVLGWMPAVAVAPVELAGGERHLCARLVDGRVACEGSNAYGQLGDAGPPTNALRVVPAVAGAVSVASGPYTSCAASNDGSVKCWGRQFSTGLQQNATIIPGLSNANRVAVGSDHACALTAGEVWCWGSNVLGQLGNGTTVSTPVPVKAIGITDAVQIAAAGSSSCARRATGVVSCWGNNNNQQLRTPAPPGGGSIPVDVIAGADAATDLAVDATSICAIVNGRVTCWGANSVKQLGDATTPSGGSVTFLPGGERSARIFIGGNHGCTTTVGGALWCWGSLDGSRSSAPNGPLRLENLEGVVTLTSGRGYSCALTPNNRITCIGAMNTGIAPNSTERYVVVEGTSMRIEPQHRI